MAAAPVAQEHKSSEPKICRAREASPIVSHRSNVEWGERQKMTTFSVGISGLPDITLAASRGINKQARFFLNSA